MAAKRSRSSKRRSRSIKRRSRSTNRRSRSTKRRSRSTKRRSRSTKRRSRSTKRKSRSVKRQRRSIIGKRKQSRRRKSRASSRTRRQSYRGRSKSLRRLLSVSGVDLSRMMGPDNIKHTTFNHYIKKLARQVNPKHTIAAETMKFINNMMTGMLHQIGTEITTRMGRRKIIKPKIINKAMKRIIPRNMREEANKRALMAVDKYNKSIARRR